MIYDAIVIGNGLFGSLITRGLRDAGRNVLLLSESHHMAGSPPAACLMRPEWTGKLGDQVIRDAIMFLGSRYNVRQLEFLEVSQKGYSKRPKCMFIPPHEIMIKPDHEVSVDIIDRALSGTWEVSGGIDGAPVAYRAKNVIVAAGIWSQKLINWHQLGIVGKVGCAFLWPRHGFNRDNFIYTWAPYRQVVGFDREDGFWVGDGNAILEKNWNNHQEDMSLERCRKYMFDGDAALERERRHPTHRMLVGIRPYTEAKPCLCKELEPGLWAAVGAAKNGTLLGAWCATQIMEKMK